MILYAKTKTEFLSDLTGGTFLSELKTAYTTNVGSITDGECRAWKNSVCKYMKDVLDSSDIAGNIGVTVEYQIPGAPGRIDMMLSGRNEQGKTVILIIELKQWTRIEECDRQFGYVILDTGDSRDVRIHPSYQAYCYKQWISMSMQDECRENVELHSIGWMHNYVPAGEADPIYAMAYKKFVDDTPLYFGGDKEKLKEAIANWLPQGDDGEGIRLLEENCIGSSKALQDVLTSLLNGNREFVLSDDQMMVYASINRYFRKAHHTKEKKVLIINGGPGTGKSVVATYSLAKLYAQYAKKGIRCYYLSKNRAPRQVYCHMLAGEDDGIFKNFFVDTGFFTRGKTEAIRSGLSVVDESHRIASEEEIVNIIEASAVSVFFIDEDQVVSLEDAGTIAGIRDYCAQKGYECIDDIRLKSQFRCNGSDAYVNWVDGLLGIRKTSVDKIDYDISVYDSFEQFYSDMQAENGTNKARIVAGDCWKWKSKYDISGKMMDFTIENSGKNGG